MENIETWFSRAIIQKLGYLDGRSNRASKSISVTPTPNSPTIPTNIIQLAVSFSPFPPPSRNLVITNPSDIQTLRPLASSNNWETDSSFPLVSIPSSKNSHEPLAKGVDISSARLNIPSDIITPLHLQQLAGETQMSVEALALVVR
jgi:hypothetical protein